jgi:hypothetical protein
MVRDNAQQILQRYFQALSVFGEQGVARCARAARLSPRRLAAVLELCIHQTQLHSNKERSSTDYAAEHDQLTARQGNTKRIVLM